MPSVEEKVRQIVVDQLRIEASEVSPSASFVDDLGADSLDRVEHIMAFEEAFGMEITDEEAKRLRPSRMRSITFKPMRSRLQQ